MALANFFDKAALSAASLLRGADIDVIRDRLQRQLIGIMFDASAVRASEGRHTLELLTNLLARLYPRLAVVPMPAPGCDVTTQGSSTRYAEALRKQAREINPRVEFSSAPEEASMLVVVGETATPSARSAADCASEGMGTSCTTVYVGSSGWNARMSLAAPVGSRDSGNPFGAGAAACLAAAAVFRLVFARELGIPMSRAPEQGLLFGPKQEPGAPWMELSLLTYEISARSGPCVGTLATLPPKVSVGETFLIGAGAIGQAAVWALSRTPGLCGVLHLVDGERVDLSNLQRYVLTTQASVGAEKAILAERTFTDVAGSPARRMGELAVASYPARWGEYIAARGDFELDRVLLALDSAEDRMAAQAALPRWIANAWTQPENLGVSRHDFLGERPCVCCLYLPTGPRKSKDVLYAEALRCTSPAELMEVRTLLHSGKPIGQDFVLRAAARLGVPPDDLLPFVGRSLDDFYASALCGGIVLRLGGHLGAGRPAEVPMAFQSALAGILLAAELVVDAARLRPRPLPARTELDIIHLDFLSAPDVLLNSPASKHPSGRCICQDPVYRERYAAKHEQPEAEQGGRRPVMA